MTLLYTHDRFLDHDTGQHPERAERLRRVARGLEESGLKDECREITWTALDVDQLLPAHEPGYVDAIRQIAQAGGGHPDADTVVSPESYDVARLAAGAAADATRRVIAGQERDALCLVRPPGHHALRDRAMGFCLFNNIAVAARLAIGEGGLDRIMIVDWDVHHGNGTQAEFWEEERVGFLSIHRFPFYPGSGDDNETGAGHGLGATVNIPVAMGTSRTEYLDRFQRSVELLAAKIRPQLILVSAGFDSHRDDPIGSLGLETEDFASLTQATIDVADEYADGRLVSILEGGYNVDVLPQCVNEHLRRLLNRK